MLAVITLSNPRKPALAVSVSANLNNFASAASICKFAGASIVGWLRQKSLRRQLKSIRGGYALHKLYGRNQRLG